MTGTRMHVVRAVAQLSIGIAPVCLFGFIRVGTNRRIFTDPSRCLSEGQRPRRSS